MIVRPPGFRSHASSARTVVVVLAVACLAAVGVRGGVAATESPAAEPSRAAIVKQLPRALSRARMRQDLFSLERIADRNGGSRAAGTPGYAASVGYVRDQLRKAGYAPKVSAFPYVSYQERLERGRQVAPVQRDLPLEALDYSPSTPAGGIRTSLVESGDGCEAGDFGAVRGLIALVERGQCFFRVKATNAQAAGAVAVLIFNNEDGSFDGTLGDSQASRIPVAGIPRALGRELAAAAGAIVELEIETETRQAKSQNVTADTQRGAKRVLIVGAHLDSVGAGAGINDNASGVAAVLEIARSLPKSSRIAVRFAFWGAEELGLFGSAAYASTVAPARVSGYINLDVLGSPTERYSVYGNARFAPRLLSYLQRGGHNAGMVDLGGRSDHASFVPRGIPVAGLFSGDYRCYHRECDRVANVDFQVLGDLASAAAFGVATFAPLAT